VHAANVLIDADIAILRKFGVHRFQNIDDALAGDAVGGLAS
jgi:hypothetical protein